jgi:hypothetical protein
MKRQVLAVLLIGAAAGAFLGQLTVTASAATINAPSQVVAEIKAGVAPTQTQEVLVLASAATAMPATALKARKAVELQNNGPNDIWCALGNASSAVAQASRRIQANGGTWSMDASTAVAIYCIAVGSDQVHLAATTFTELVQ